MQKTDLAAIWNEQFDKQIAETEQYSAFKLAEWKTAGRKSKANPDGEDVEWWRASGIEQLETYWEWLSSVNMRIATMPDGFPGIEWASIVEFGGTPVKVVVDAIFEHNGEYIIVDFKSGSRSPVGVIQLALYASAIERQYGVRPRWGSFYMTRKGELEEMVDLKHWDGPYFDYVFGAMNHSIAAGYYPPIVGMNCQMCSFTEQCQAAGGSKSSEYPLHIINKENGQ